MMYNEKSSTLVFSLLVLIKCSDCSNIDHRRSRTPHHWLKKQAPRSTAEDTSALPVRNELIRCTDYLLRLHSVYILDEHLLLGSV